MSEPTKTGEVTVAVEYLAYALRIAEAIKPVMYGSEWGYIQGVEVRLEDQPIFVVEADEFEGQAIRLLPELTGLKPDGTSEATR